MKFVIIEDEVRIREGIIRLLAKMNPEFEIVGEAENGIQGLELINEQKPDVIITDIRMPCMDGLAMLKEVYQSGSKIKSIVLSAYSDFDYARQAIHLGVTDYLLKPVVLSEFQQAIENVISQLELDRMQKPRQLGTLERIMEGILSGSLKPDEEILAFLEQQHHITDKTHLAVICFYLGTLQEEKMEKTQSRLMEMLRQKKELSYCVIKTMHKKSLIAVVYGYENGHMLERWMQYQILNSREKQLQVGIGWTEVSDIRNLKQQFDALYPYLDWNLTLGGEVVISYPKITKIQTVPCIYPVKVEDRLKLAVCAGRREEVLSCMKDFHAFFQSGQVYEPRQIKECYVRFLWAFIGIAAEVGTGREKPVGQQKLLERIMGAKTSNELKAVMEEMTDSLLSGNDNEITHLTVKRAVSMGQEFYGSGITLDEIADKLNITPEYLGTLFARQMGVNFSTYMKNYRMAKAKELLIGTSLKLYEIADKVGYSDARYFSRVFKECFGQLPAEYRKTHK